MSETEGQYMPEAWRMQGYYPESYAKFMAALGIGIDYSDSDFDRYEAEFRADLAAHDIEVARKAVEPFVALNDVFLHMRDRVAGYVDAPPVARFFADGAAAFEWAATNIRRVRDGQSPLDPPTPEQSRARAEQIGEN